GGHDVCFEGESIWELEECPSGACCLDGDLCLPLIYLDCNDRGGTYLGDDLPCEPETCHPLPTRSASWGAIKSRYR
ncbi:MAG: hypothetical protein KC729_19010, partial [Candidatus Eisenbacteria bacterium]|nr:hypothetical protein [Candidatus Eisenbacteria bacterium]